VMVSTGWRSIAACARSQPKLTHPGASFWGYQPRTNICTSSYTPQFLRLHQPLLNPEHPKPILRLYHLFRCGIT